MLNGRESKAYLSEMLSSSGLYTASEIQALPFINQEKPVVENWGYPVMPIITGIIIIPTGRVKFLKAV